MRRATRCSIFLNKDYCFVPRPITSSMHRVSWAVSWFTWQFDVKIWRAHIHTHTHAHNAFFYCFTRIDSVKIRFYSSHGRIATENNHVRSHMLEWSHSSYLNHIHLNVLTYPIIWSVYDANKHYFSQGQISR